jgi:hypothetical protein
MNTRDSRSPGGATWVVKLVKLLKVQSQQPENCALRRPPKKIERGAFRGCHNFEYLTLLNSSQDATTRDRQGIDEYNLREVVDTPPPRD